MTPHLVHQLLERAATRSPDRPAVVDGDRTWTFRQLDRRANQMAHALGGLGVVRGDRVGVYLDKSIEAVTAVYAIMKCGAAYVPLDPSAPVARLALAAQDCGMRVIVSAAAKDAGWAALADGGGVEQVLSVDTSELVADVPGASVHGPAAIDAAPTTAPRAGTVDQDLAYILYTSGSTGSPKGVMITHRAAIAFIGWAADQFALGPEDRLSSFAPLHFDLSIFDLYAAACAEAAVVIVPARTAVFPKQIVQFVATTGVTVWYTVPSALTMVALRGGLRPGDLPALRVVLFAGEVFPTKYLRPLMIALPHVHFANLYGPTETNVCTWHDVDGLPDEGEVLPIGIPITNDDVFAVRDDGVLASPGERGELFVRGATVMRGYWNDPDRTARALVPDPRGLLRDLVYRTGDIVEPLTTGGYVYVGRRDNQVKSRGYRIELGDIEVAINRHPGVEECAVVAVADERVTNRLVAFVAVLGSTTEVDLARHCAELLPGYMVPGTIQLLERLPKTSTGKVDRADLRERAR